MINIIAKISFNKNNNNYNKNDNKSAIIMQIVTVIIIIFISVVILVTSVGSHWHMKSAELDYELNELCCELPSASAAINRFTFRVMGTSSVTATTGVHSLLWVFFYYFLLNASYQFMNVVN